MDSFKLVLMETSDIHGSVFPQHYGTNEKAELGLAKVATLIKQQRRANEHTITIDNGDLIQGTPLTYHYAKFQHTLPNPMVAILNDLSYDAAVVGNHEFNYGMDLLNQAVKEANNPWLSANIIDVKSDQPYFGKPYVIKAFENGPRVGVLGLTTKHIPNWEKEEHIQGLVFEDVVTSAKKWVKILKEEEQVDLVVVSYHGGFERDLHTGEPTESLTEENQGFALCMEVEGIDVLLTGHQHRQIAGEKVNDVLVLQPGNNGIALGKATIEMKRENGGFQVVRKESELLSPVGVAADQQVLDSIQAYEDEVQKWLDQPIGKMSGDMTVTDPMAIRLKDNALIEFINKVQMDVAGVDVSNTALFDNLATGFPKNVTMRSVVSNYIYPNTLVVLRVTGQIVKDALERSASYFELLADGKVGVSKEFTTPKPAHYNYDMWEGIDYEIDIRKPIGERIVHLKYKGSKLLPGAALDVVMNNYRASGGGDYLMYKDCLVVKEIPIDVSELIANYILEHKVIEATVNHNWKVIY